MVGKKLHFHAPIATRVIKQFALFQAIEPTNRSAFALIVYIYANIRLLLCFLSLRIKVDAKTPQYNGKEVNKVGNMQMLNMLRVRVTDRQVR